MSCFERSSKIDIHSLLAVELSQLKPIENEERKASRSTISSRGCSAICTEGSTRSISLVYADKSQQWPIVHALPA
jgi:hypothetical protein